MKMVSKTICSFTKNFNKYAFIHKHFNNSKILHFGCLNVQKPFLTLHHCFSHVPLKVAIVGSGPAGFYTAQSIIKKIPDSKVDIFESLPVPFGLVRFGVAPDHQDVKNVINTFTKIAESPMVDFYGNIKLGQDISIKELLKAYSAVVLAFGASEDKMLSIPGESLNNVMSANSFVKWYNGYPGSDKMKINLDGETCMILGQGNVAVDVARMILTPSHMLRKTDISEHAIKALEKSRIKKVYLVGRRGALQAAFTIAEVRGLLKVPLCKTILDPKDFEEIKNRLNEIQRPKKRLMELLLKQLESEPKEYDKELHFLFQRSPIAFDASSSDPSAVGNVELSVNQLEGEFGLNQKAVMTDERKNIQTDLVIKSVGYRSVMVDDDIPFDVKRGLVPNQAGRVLDLKGLYCSGWLKTGPVGVLVSTMNDAYETAASVTEDYKKDSLNKCNSQHIDELLNRIKHKCITFSDWKKIDEHEKNIGAKQGKIREKIVDINEMMKIVGKTNLD